MIRVFKRPTIVTQMQILHSPVSLVRPAEHPATIPTSLKRTIKIFVRASICENAQRVVGLKKVAALCLLLAFCFFSYI